MTPSFIDFHCHPHMKPYGKSFRLSPVGHNSTDRDAENSIWFRVPADLWRKGLQMAGIVKFTQTDIGNLARGNVRIICASLYPIERGFFNNKLGAGGLSDLALDFITSVSKQRVDYIQGITNYFEDLEGEYKYYLQMDGKYVHMDSGPCGYKLVRNYGEIESYMEANPDDTRTVFIIMSIEGLHALNIATEDAPDELSFLSNMRELKNWEYKPFFVTFAHHFFNELCGHAKSLFGMVGSKTDQSKGILTGFTDLGKKVLREALDNTNGKRIYIDIKHMSPQSRKEYFHILETEYKNENIPVIVSHGAVNGLKSMDDPTPGNDHLSSICLTEGINFYDNEILMVAKTQGIFALQTDERRLACEAYIKDIKHSLFLNKIRHYRAALLWNNIQYIAELLDKNGLPAWDHIGIGSDFDGIIDPLNGFLTSAAMPDLQQYVERYAFTYMNDRGKKILRPENCITPSDIVNKIFSENGTAFLKRWFV